MTFEDKLRAYWLAQFETIEPRVEPVHFEDRQGGVAVRVQQVVTVKATGHVT